jgi:spore germination protein GerM
MTTTLPDHRLRRVLASVSALLAMSLVASCAMPSDQRAQPLSIDEDIAEVLEPAPATSAPTTSTPEDTLERGLYFIEDDLIRRQSAQIAETPAKDLTAVLNELVAGTRQQNHRSAIPSGVQVVDTRIDENRRVATIVLLDNTLFTLEVSGDRLRAIAQFVYTATDRSGTVFNVDRVQFEIDGEVRAIPTGGGSDTSEPVGRCDYERVASESSRPSDCPGATTTTTVRTTFDVVEP